MLPRPGKEASDVNPFASTRRRVAFYVVEHRADDRIPVLQC
jgi:hypothetical protein